MSRIHTIGLLGLALAACAGCAPKAVRTTAAGSLDRYVAEAKATPPPAPDREGSLWTDVGPRGDLFRDFKARRLNDVVTILVLETTEANSSADTASSRDTQLDAGYTHLFGAEKHIKELGNLVSGQSSGSFKGAGSTSRASTLSTTLTARVKDVLPNGYLVVEGVREVRVNDENQTIYLTGVVRPVDIGYRNVVPSSAIAQMEVRVEGHGEVSRPIKPGWLYRILTGIMPF